MEDPRAITTHLGMTRTQMEYVCALQAFPSPFVPSRAPTYATEKPASRVGRLFPLNPPWKHRKCPLLIFAFFNPTKGESRLNAH